MKINSRCKLTEEFGPASYVTDTVNKRTTKLRTELVLLMTRSDPSGTTQALDESPQFQTNCNQKTNISSDRMHESRILK